jgi:glycosyltransferase involved in cell wall biosynthesis
MLSFVVPAHNEERYVGATLRSIHEAARAVGDAYEIVVADDASADRTADHAAAGGARVVRVAHRQISRTRNAGARASRGEHLVFVDADTTVNEPVVRAAVVALRKGAVGGGATVTVDGRLPPWARVAAPVFVHVTRAMRLAAGCFLFCSRRAFDATGGFDETLFAGEEVVMSQALKRRGRFVVLRERVLTSGRKLRAHSGRELLGRLGALATGGMSAVRDRRNVAIWYDERRDDPDSDP